MHYQYIKVYKRIHPFVINTIYSVQLHFVFPPTTYYMYYMPRIGILDKFFRRLK